MLENILRYSKAIAAAASTFVVTLGLVWQDEAVSLHELGVLKAAAIAVLVAAGVATSTRTAPELGLAPGVWCDIIPHESGG